MPILKLDLTDDEIYHLTYAISVYEYYDEDGKSQRPKTLQKKVEKAVEGSPCQHQNISTTLGGESTCLNCHKNLGK